MTRNEAHLILFRGQSNVKQMANKLGVELSDLQASFAKFVRNNPIDPDVWRGDVEPSWPYWC